MIISLKRFLRTGHLGQLHVGLSADEVQAALGLPEDTAKSVRKHRFSDIWLYGGVEVWLDQSAPQICRGLWIECMGHGWCDAFKMPAGCVVEDWELQPHSPRDVTEAYLQHSDIPAFVPEPKKPGKKGAVFASRQLTVPSSGVDLSFDEKWRLIAFHAGPPAVTSATPTEAL